MAGRPKRGSALPLDKTFVSGGTQQNNATPQKQRQAPPAPSISNIPQKPLVSPQVPTKEVKNENAPNFNEQTNDSANVLAMDTAITGSMEVDGDENKRKSFFRKFLGGVKKKPSVRAKEKKIRQNRRLRKVLIPKNALMALHEVKAVKISDFIINNKAGGGFTAEVTVNNIQYEGFGSSKNAAKNNACEKAIRDLVISKMLLKPSKTQTTEKNENGSNNDQQESENGDVQMEGDDIDDDDVPMANLASFALYKLFSEWESEGFEVPEFRQHTPPPASIAPQQEKPKKPATVRNELPDNWESMHPTTLLCIMRPGVVYTDLGCEGTPPNAIQKIGVEVCDKRFIGIGRSKKLARKHAAIEACNSLFGSKFILEDSAN